MTYTEDFYALESKVAAVSAAVVVPWVLAETGASYVVDVGCGTGAWIAEAIRQGCTGYGVDFDVPPALALAPIVNQDLTGGFLCHGFDLAICLEVAEHLPAKSAVPLVHGLSRAKAVLFSAATPGQPGIGHINCRSHDYWHGLFEMVGKTPTRIGQWFTEPVADFYRRNMYLYR